MITTQYDDHKQVAESASERAHHYGTAAAHRKAAVAHLIAGGHAGLLGDKEAAKMHDKKADEHISLLKKCSDFDPAMLTRNYVDTES